MLNNLFMLGSISSSVTMSIAPSSMRSHDLSLTPEGLGHGFMEPQWAWMVSWQSKRMTDTSLFLPTSQDNFHLCLRVLTSVVVSAEERENADNQTHPHKQRQSDQEEATTQGDLGTNATNNEQDLLHPPARTTMSHWVDLTQLLMLVEIHSILF